MMPFVNQLRNAHSFVEVAMAGCTAAQRSGMHCVMSLHGATGEPMITVDNVGESPANIFAAVMPILALTETLGSVRWSSPQPISDPLRAQLATMTMHVSVRLAQLGYRACGDDSDYLTARQVDAARLAARGHTNGEIATLLALSENTVKKHLKEVFERLQISSRTELALRYARLATNDDVPAGVTYLDGCTITKLQRRR